MKATVIINYKTKLPKYFLYNKTVEDDSPSRLFKGEIDAFISKGNYAHLSKTYRNEDGVLTIKGCTKGENGTPIITFSKALVTFNRLDEDFFLPPKRIRIIFNGKTYGLRPGEEITFGAYVNPEVVIKKY